MYAQGKKPRPSVKKEELVKDEALERAIELMKARDVLGSPGLRRVAIKVLGIETSCDETAAAVVDEKRAILSNVVSSQLHLHRRYQGIVPELASRAHLQKIASVIDRARVEAGVRSLDAVAYTRGLGLMGLLLIGKVAAQTLAHILGVPLVGVNHLRATFSLPSSRRSWVFPLVALIVSGGHTDLVFSRGPGRYKVLGRTRDDAGRRGIRQGGATAGPWLSGRASDRPLGGRGRRLGGDISSAVDAGDGLRSPGSRLPCCIIFSVAVSRANRSSRRKSKISARPFRMPW